MTRRYDKALRPVGLRVTQLHILSYVAENPECHPGDVWHALNIEKSTFSRSVSLLIEEGLIAPDAGADGRRANLMLTRAGERRLDKALPLWQAAQKRVREQLTKETWNVLAGVLPRVGELTDKDD
jgi:DNA-binding MarR family transcriptional regulator